LKKTTTAPHVVSAITSFCETLIWGREGAAPCHLLIAQSNWSTGQLVNGVVNAGQILVKTAKMVKQKGHNWKLDRN